jgi:hypothetical protein
MLTASLVAVVGPAILAHEVEDALVDRLGAPISPSAQAIGVVGAGDDQRVTAF